MHIVYRLCARGVAMSKVLELQSEKNCFNFLWDQQVVGARMGEVGSTLNRSPLMNLPGAKYHS